MNLETNKVMDEKLWDMHLSRQFNWTIKLRKMIYDKISLEGKEKILDAGCGIGLISRELAEISGGEVHGIDLNVKLIEKAKKNFPDGDFQKGSILKIPFEDNTFDVAFCHFVLMWLRNPYQAMSEMIRVTKPGGWIVCAAEPDYGAKIDFPDDYNAAASTVRALQAEGADPFFGRRLKSVFANAKLKPEIGVFADLWDDETMKREFEHVWKFAELTARGTIQKGWVKSVQMRDREALEKGERITLLPLFWGIAQKPE